jgi:hypothetical protein
MQGDTRIRVTEIQCEDNRLKSAVIAYRLSLVRLKLRLLARLEETEVRALPSERLPPAYHLNSHKLQPFAVPVGPGEGIQAAESLRSHLQRAGSRPELGSQQVSMLTMDRTLSVRRSGDGLFKKRK